MNTSASMKTSSSTLCQLDDLVPFSGVAVLYQGRQIALFYLPDQEQQIYALDNYDPIGQANVLSRGIIGDKGGELVVASPLYKQHFSLLTGICIEDPSVRVSLYSVALEGDQVLIAT